MEGVSDYFTHKKGLRQDDPLSPMLFDLTVDVLQKMMEVVNQSTNAHISRKLKKAVIIYQYADDTVFILRHFLTVSGLNINFSKSSWVLINIPSNQLLIILAILRCSLSQFPINYLGLPLTLKKPTKDLYMPLREVRKEI